MAVMLRFPPRSRADPQVDRRVGDDAPTAKIVILPCIRREAMVPAGEARQDAPVLLKA
jgi:hypothetical protein